MEDSDGAGDLIESGRLTEWLAVLGVDVPSDSDEHGDAAAAAEVTATVLYDRAIESNAVVVLRKHTHEIEAAKFEFKLPEVARQWIGEIVIHLVNLSWLLHSETCLFSNYPNI